MTSAARPVRKSAGVPSAHLVNACLGLPLACPFQEEIDFLSNLVQRILSHTHTHDEPHEKTVVRSVAVPPIRLDFPPSAANRASRKGRLVLRMSIPVASLKGKPE